MSIYSDRSMTDLSAEQQATQALRYLLQRIKADDRLYHLVGLGSQAFDLLTEAYSTLSGEDLEKLRKSISQSA